LILRASPHLLIIGGGQSAKHILFGIAERFARGERDLADLRVTVVESSDEFGTGLAWSRRYALPQHLSSLAEPFSRVAYGDGQRRQFAGAVRLLVEQGLSVDLLPCREAIDLEPANSRLRVTLSTGEILDADFAVLATGHWRAADPLDGTDGYCFGPWPADRLQDAIFDDRSRGQPRRVIILGGYLNAVDAALSVALRAGRFHGDGFVTFEPSHDVHVTLASRTGQLPRVWGRMPPPDSDRWLTASELQALIAGSGGFLPLEACFDLLASKLSRSRSEVRPARRQRTLAQWLDALRAERARLGSWRILRKDISAVTEMRNHWGGYDVTRACHWQAVLFGALPQLSEHSHAMDAEDQHYFDSVVRTPFFNHVMPMTIDSAVRLEALMRCGRLDTIAVGRNYAVEPTPGGPSRFRLSWSNPDGSIRSLSASHVVNALGQPADISRHPSRLFQRALQRGLIQPALRRFGRQPAQRIYRLQAQPIVIQNNTPFLRTGGVFVDPATCEAISRVPAGSRDAVACGRLFAMGPNLIGQFIDAQGIGQVERDTRRVLSTIAAALRPATGFREVSNVSRGR
jgi:hypothetical protein